jgi:hypothetical protein
MAIFKIEEAKREGARLVLGLGGISGGGKTATALKLAWGLANYDSKKVGFLDTENRRGRLYADDLRDANGVIHRFLIGDLVPPFSPARYIEAISAFVQAGVEVLVIDSVSHEWNGIGGCEDIANGPDANGKAPKNGRWNIAKSEHKKFMSAMLQSPLHIIVCMRAQPKVKLENQAGKTVYIDQGILPIQEKSFTFELTASMMLWNGGTSREILKCPAELVGIFGETGKWSEGYLTPEHGKALRDWVDGGNEIDKAAQNAWDHLLMICEQGMAALAAAWKALPAELRQKISPNGSCPDTLKQSAQAFDQHNAMTANGETAEVEDLNSQILGN